jgi:hypothetical protein
MIIGSGLLLLSRLLTFPRFIREASFHRHDLPFLAAASTKFLTHVETVRPFAAAAFTISANSV